jgi:hypothetical protein
MPLDLGHDQRADRRERRIDGRGTGFLSRRSFFATAGGMALAAALPDCRRRWPAPACRL